MFPTTWYHLSRYARIRAAEMLKRVSVQRKFWEQSNVIT